MAPLKVRMMPAVMRHIDAATAYYGSQADERLIARLLREIDDAVDQIAAFPLSCPIFHRATRRKLLTAFPYWLYYRLDDDTLQVFALLHAHRSERFLKSQAK